MSKKQNTREHAVGVLDALPRGTVFKDVDGEIWQKVSDSGDLRWQITGGPRMASGDALRYASWEFMKKVLLDNELLSRVDASAEVWVIRVVNGDKTAEYQCSPGGLFFPSEARAEAESERLYRLDYTREIRTAAGRQAIQEWDISKLSMVEVWMERDEVYSNAYNNAAIPEVSIDYLRKRALLNGGSSYIPFKLAYSEEL